MASPENRADPQVPILRLWFSVLCGYLSFGATIQVLPDMVTHRFTGDSVMIGTAVGVAFLATAAGRPFAGLLTDAGYARAGVASGGVLVALGAAGHLWAPSFAVLLVSRLLMGIGEAALFSGALPWVLGGAPAHRRGRVAGWFGMSMWSGLAAGPVLATVLTRWYGLGVTWLAVAGLGALAAVLVLTTRRVAAETRKPLRFPRSLREVVPLGASLPGVALGLASYGYGSVAALLIVHLRSNHVGGTEVVLSVFAVCFLITRAVGSPLVDRYGGARVATVSVAVEAGGLLVLAFTTHELVIVLGVALAGAGVALMYPSTVALALSRGDVSRPGASVGAATSFWDLGVMAAGPLGGVLADRFGFSVAFGAAAVAGLVCVVLVCGWLRGNRSTIDQYPAAADNATKIQ